MEKKVNFPWYYVYRLSQVITVIYVFSIPFTRLPLVFNLIAAVCIICVKYMRSKATEQKPEKFKAYVRQSRPIYEVLDSILLILIIIAPTIANTISPEHIVAVTRIIWVLLIALEVFVGYQNYKWRTMHADTIKTKKRNVTGNK